MAEKLEGGALDKYCADCPYEGYVTAFYELAALMGIGAQPATPEKVWLEQMLPRLQLAFAPPRHKESLRQLD